MGDDGLAEKEVREREHKSIRDLQIADSSLDVDSNATAIYELCGKQLTIISRLKQG